ncbi:MAG: porin family protein [Duncaniella sp.]|nr:porin family protein [Duncaniella sp.]MDE7146079.1 porin family protein [Duncaniella sp.]
MRPLLLLILTSLALHASNVSAQSQAQAENYKFDAGIGVGMSGYLGDANESNIFAHPGVALNASLRYLVNTRWAFRASLTGASLNGDTGGMDNMLPGGASYDFKSWVYDLGARAEFNFLNYGIGESYKQLSRVSPYLSLGLGVAMANVEGDTFTAMTLPMGIGVKYKLSPRLNLGLEFTMTKVFGDNIDGKQLSDLYMIKSSFLKNTDWYSVLMFAVSYEFGRRCVVCHRID